MSDGGPAPIGPERGFFARLFGLYLSPGESLAAIVHRPSVWPALAAFLALNVGFAAVWVQRVEPAQFMRLQLEELGVWERLPPEQRAAALQGATRGFTLGVLRNAAFFPMAFVVVTAAVLLFVFRFFYAGEVTFAQSVAVVAHCYLAVGLVQSPLILLVMLLKDDWNLDPQSALQANPTLIVAVDAVPRPLYSLLGSLDLFSFWTIGLLAAGYALAARRPTRSALWGVITPWAVFVAGKVALGVLIRALTGA